MYYLLKNNPDLAPIIAEVTFAGFSPGSLVMSWEFVLAAENKSEAEIESLLQNDLNAGLADENLKETVPFNVNKAHVLSISNGKFNFQILRSFEHIWLATTLAN